DQRDSTTLNFILFLPPQKSRGRAHSGLVAPKRESAKADGMRAVGSASRDDTDLKKQTRRAMNDIAPQFIASMLVAPKRVARRRSKTDGRSRNWCATCCLPRLSCGLSRRSCEASKQEAKPRIQCGAPTRATPNGETIAFRPRPINRS